MKGLLAPPDAAIRLRVAAADWRSAVTAAGEALRAAGAVTADYSDEMIAMVEEHGPYIVIAPGLALAHARPGRSVLADGLSVVTLASPVPFGHPYNDPVSVVVGLSVRAADRHISAVAELARAFDDPDAVQHIAEAADADEVRAILAPELDQSMPEDPTGGDAAP